LVCSYGSVVSYETIGCAGRGTARLGVPLPTFDNLRLGHGLSAVDQTHAQDGSQRNL
jgi:hypothetical protein